MGTPNVVGIYQFDTQLDCDWLTIDAVVQYQVHFEEGGKHFDIVSVKTYAPPVITLEHNIFGGLNLTPFITESYILDLIEDDFSNVDYQWYDHG